MFSLQPLQWAGVALIVAGLIVYAWPRLKAMLPSVPDMPDFFDDDDDVLDRMARLDQLQADLEARGCRDEAELAGTWYALLRNPVQEAPSP